eukprot:gene13031-14295_t
MGNWKSLNSCWYNNQDSHHDLIIQNNVFTNFPDCLLQEIVQYLSELEIIELCRGNKDLKIRLLKNILESYIFLTITKKPYMKYEDYPFAMSLTKNYPNTFSFTPKYLQRRLHASLSPFAFSRYLVIKCSTDFLSLIVEHKVQYIHYLQIELHQRSPHALPKVTNDGLVLLSNMLEKSNLIVHKLSLFNIGNVRLPVFHGVVSLTITHCTYRTSEEMNIHQNTSLRHLELRSCTVHDLDSFSHIYDVELHNCKVKLDTSGLYEYHRQTMNSPNDSHARIFVFPYSANMNDYNLQNIKALELSCLTMPIVSLPSSLLSLSISSSPLICNLPANNLRSVTIHNCCKFTSLDNMSHIKSVTLSRLNITTLDGLGQENLSITIIDCDKINDWSAVRQNKFVYFQITRNYEITSLTLQEPDLRHLAIQEVTHYRSPISFLPSLATDKRLKELFIDCNLYISGPLWSLLDRVELVPTLEKVEFYPIMNDVIQNDNRFKAILSKSRFSAHFSHRRLVLLSENKQRFQVTSREIL